MSRTRLAVITDAWFPQINGVVRTLDTTIKHLGPDYKVEVFEPSMFPNYALPGYNEIRLANPKGLAKKLELFDPQSIHIATEGPLGWAALIWCLRNDKSFTTSYHTQFPEYLHKKLRVPTWLTYSVLRFFHSYSSNIMVNTPTMRERLKTKGFKRTRIWSRGVDTSVFSSEGPKDPTMAALDGTILLNVGRVSSEKNLEAFYELTLDAFPNHSHRKLIKVQVGDGPQLAEYKAKYPDVIFLGAKSGAELAAAYRSADVFVFPSKSDTFGLVMLESIASGVPIAAYPVVGPIDVVVEGSSGYLFDELSDAVMFCLEHDMSDSCTKEAKAFTWDACTRQFKDNLV